jgi:hypothetical protein
MELQQKIIENKITTRTTKLAGAILFDNVRVYSCPQCGSIYYFYDEDQLTFVTTHRNCGIDGASAYLIPRCQRCEAEFAHATRAIDLMRRRNELGSD